MAFYFTSNFNLYLYLINKLNIANTTQSAILMLVMILICIVGSYLIGSINTALLISKKKYHDDIRKHGSGNAGATNILRTYGIKDAVFTFLGDALKAGVAMFLGSLLISWDVGGAIASFFVVLGHMFPVFHKFNGGKGVSCMAMIVLLSCPWAFLILFPLYILIVLATKYISLASVMAALMYPLFAYAFLKNNMIVNNGEGAAIPVFGILIGGFVIFMHRANIKRLREGNESKVGFLVKAEEKREAKRAAKRAAKAKGTVSENKENSENNKQEKYQFTVCPSCKSTIPVSRKVCVYCGTENPKYVPGSQEKDNKKKK